MPANASKVSILGKDEATAASLTNPVPVDSSAGGSATATPTNVASSASSVTILVANTARVGAAVYNDSTQILYLLLGTSAASTTNYTVQMGTLSYYEVPFGYVGRINGIWASANGNARVTELT